MNIGDRWPRREGPNQDPAQNIAGNQWLAGGSGQEKRRDQVAGAGRELQLLRPPPHQTRKRDRDKKWFQQTWGRAAAPLSVNEAHSSSKRSPRFRPQNSNTETT